MNDLIERQAAIEAVRNCKILDVKNLLIDKAEAMTNLMMLPSAQPEIVRCKDCKWWDFAPDNTMLPDWHRCRWYGGRLHTRYEDFCSRGERSE